MIYKRNCAVENRTTFLKYRCDVDAAQITEQGNWPVFKNEHLQRKIS
jgi:hypothetical protein